MLRNASIAPVLPAEDLQRAKTFYEEKVGLKITNNTQDGVMFECGNGTFLSVYKRERTKAEHTVAGFAVEDLESEMKELRERGVVFEDYDQPGLKTVNGVAALGNDKGAWFKDTEGNILSLFQMGSA
jgi:predicted enzyme related to lactoylglutathione lyase